MKHEQSRIYLTSRELIADAAVVVGKLPPGFGYLADQLRRASSSVLLNFAEVAPGKAWEEASMS